MSLIPPRGRSSRDREREQWARGLRRPGEPSVFSGTHGNDASAFAAAPPGAGTAAEGFLGFALGMSGLGGEDWLLPSTEGRSVGRSFRFELN